MNDKHSYEGIVWQYGDEPDNWHAKVLRNGIFFDSRNNFPTRDEALAWCREQAQQDRDYIEAERKAERVAL